MKTRLGTLILPLAAGLACADASRDDASGGTVEMAALDAVFADYSASDGPGCAFAVSRDGQQVMARAYGMANLEWDLPNTPETVFEPGSVSKQFTAAATILLALDGRIDLDDDIREYFPEMPDYGEPITVRMLIHHTSGLRDWGSVAGIHGWARTTRIHTHKHALDIASRQRALNYEPGRYYSYTNTGYNLQAMLVERVTGQTFDEFSQERIFRPLGMTKTQWRDDFTEIVEERSIGYRRGDDDEWHMLMPFETCTETAVCSRPSATFSGSPATSTRAKSAGPSSSGSCMSRGCSTRGGRSATRADSSSAITRACARSSIPEEPRRTGASSPASPTTGSRCR
ncbi:MAG: beta-lactamase family protein [Gemmatimonadales bacterium]|nr:beta-lactamase family protein [Gemmatimonadales bacterium]